MFGEIIVVRGDAHLRWTAPPYSGNSSCKSAPRIIHVTSIVTVNRAEKSETAVIWRAHNLQPHRGAGCINLGHERFREAYTGGSAEGPGVGCRARNAAAGSVALSDRTGRCRRRSRFCYCQATFGKPKHGNSVAEAFCRTGAGRSMGRCSGQRPKTDLRDG